MMGSEKTQSGVASRNKLKLRFAGAHDRSRLHVEASKAKGSGAAQ